MLRCCCWPRNFGHQLALTCGLDYSTGDAVITMDGDMQHPPELIPELVRLWEEGHDVVRTIRDSTEDAGWANLSHQNIITN